MRIFEKQPDNWVDLQNKVAHILSVCGYEVETPKTIKTLRGTVEVDVFAKSSDIIIVCECKHWESNVPQSVVMSFRTVVDEIGANKGIIVAKKGFQSGAYEFVNNTIVILKSWEEFLDTYKDMYVKSSVKNLLKNKSKFYRLAAQKFEYINYYKALSNDDKSIINHLCGELERVIFYGMTSMCTSLQFEHDPDIGWNMNYVDELILKAEEMFNTKFLSYYDYFKYVDEQTSRLAKEIKKIYGITEFVNQYEY